MKLYLRTLSVLYFTGFALHAADILDLRLELSKIGLVWKIWVWFLCVFDLAAALGLWKSSLWGQVIFVTIACSQLIAYIGFTSTFGDQTFLVWFHFISLLFYLIISVRQRARPVRIASRVS